MAQIPHFALPFRFAPGGHAVEVEQDSVEDVAACIEAAFRTEPGERDGMPDFGVPDQVFEVLPLDMEKLAAAAAAYEPRTELLLEDAPELLEETARRIRAEVATREEVQARLTPPKGDRGQRGLLSVQGSPGAIPGVVQVTAQSAVTFTGLDGDLAGEFYVGVVGHYMEAGAERHIAIRPNGSAPSASECHLHCTSNTTDAAAEEPSHSPEVMTGGVFIARTYRNDTGRNAVRVAASLQASDPTNQGHRVWTSSFQARSAGDAYYHLGGEAHGWWEGGGKITSLTVDFGADFTGWVSLWSLTNSGLAPGRHT